MHTMGLFQKWTKECNTKQEVLEIAATKKLLNVMPKEVHVEGKRVEVEVDC